MLPMVTGFMNFGQQTIRATRYIGQSFMTTLSHINRLPVTIEYPYENINHIGGFPQSNLF
jgi:formate hydrogenlyase subunit 6/NADH:ubiquinone oxidoreductase subunit I